MKKQDMRRWKEKMETKNTLLSKFIEIQNLQHKLDNLKKENRKIMQEIKSLQQTIPSKIRLLDLK